MFPLPLTVFERYMLDDNRPGYPMTCVAEMQLAGKINRDAFSAVFRDQVFRHPLLFAVVKRPRRGMPCWISAGERPAAVEWGGLSDTVPVTATDPIDLESEPGMRLWVRRDSERAVVTMVFHHACCDGIGAARFFEDLLCAYHAKLAGGRCHVCNVSRLMMRGAIPRLGRLRERLGNELRTFVREGYQWFAHPVTPLGVPQERSIAAGRDLLGEMLTHTFDATALGAILEAARKDGATLNDFLLASLFCAIRKWNERHAPDPATPWLRIAVPQNLRVAADRWMPAANKVTMCFLTRAVEACRESDELLAGIRSEMANARQWLRGKSLLRAIHFGQSLPVFRGAFLESGACLATAVLSNVGDFNRWFCRSLPQDGSCVRAGGLRLESIVCVPPVRPNTHVVFCAATYGGLLRITMRSDPHCIPRTHAKQLLTLYAAEIENRMR